MSETSTTVGNGLRIRLPAFSLRLLLSLLLTLPVTLTFGLLVAPYPAQSSQEPAIEELRDEYASTQPTRSKRQILRDLFHLVEHSIELEPGDYSGFRGFLRKWGQTFNIKRIALNTRRQLDLSSDDPVLSDHLRNIVFLVGMSETTERTAWIWMPLLTRSMNLGGPAQIAAGAAGVVLSAGELLCPIVAACYVLAPSPIQNGIKFLRVQILDRRIVRPVKTATRFLVSPWVTLTPRLELVRHDTDEASGDSPETELLVETVANRTTVSNNTLRLVFETDPRLPGPYLVSAELFKDSLPALVTGTALKRFAFLGANVLDAIRRNARLIANGETEYVAKRFYISRVDESETAWTIVMRPKAIVLRAAYAKRSSCDRRLESSPRPRA